MRGCASTALREDARDLASRLRAADAVHAPPRVAALEPELVVERHAEVGEVDDPRRRLLRQRAHGALAAEAAPGAQRVLRVELRRVVRTRSPRRRLPARASSTTSAPGPSRRAGRGLGGRAERSVEAGDAAAHDDQVVLVGVSFRLTVENLRRILPTSPWPPCCRCGTASSRRCSGSARASPTPAPGRSPAATSTPTRRSRSRSAATSPRRSTSASSRTSSSSGRWSDPHRHPDERQLATAYLGLVPTDVDPAVPDDTAWHPVDRPAARWRSTTARSCSPAASACARSSRTRTSASRSRRRAFTIPELRELYAAALGYEVSATNLQRVLLRRELLEETGERRPPGPHGGRPATVFRFRSRELEVTDQFAVLRPPTNPRD